MSAAHRDLLTALQNPEEWVQQACQRFAVSILVIAGKQGNKSLHSILLPEAWFNAVGVLIQPSCQCIKSWPLPRLQTDATRLQQICIPYGN